MSATPDTTGLREVFFAKVAITADCWLWTGSLNEKGYGNFSASGVKIRAHRWSYEHHVGPIPEGLEIDHLCRVRNCVNPDHLEPVTHAENVRRAAAAKTHCDNGHEFTPENTYIRTCGNRQCRACSRDRNVTYRARRRGVAA